MVMVCRLVVGRCHNNIVIGLARLMTSATIFVFIVMEYTSMRRTSLSASFSRSILAVSCLLYYVLVVVYTAKILSQNNYRRFRVYVWGKEFIDLSAFFLIKFRFGTFLGLVVPRKTKQQQQINYSKKVRALILVIIILCQF